MNSKNNNGLDQTISIRNSEGYQIDINLRDLILMRGEDAYKFINDLGYETEFKDAEYEQILSQMLSRVSDKIDKRQGSVIFDTLAPAAVELTEAYIEREANRALSYASLSHGEWLDMRVFEHGVSRMNATKAKRYGWFYADDAKSIEFDDINLGAKFSIANDVINFSAINKIRSGVYELECDEAGIIGNTAQSGTKLIPVEYMPGLAYVELGDIIVTGENIEGDDELFERFVKYITRPPFGGNRADYEEYFRKIDGIGQVRLYRADPEKGHVTAYLLGVDLLPVSTELIGLAQNAADPPEHKGEGIGMAPMAHIVHVKNTSATSIDIKCKLVLVRGVTVPMIQEEVRQKIDEYLYELRKEWAKYISADSPDYKDMAVRISGLEAAILQCRDVADVYESEICGLFQNHFLEKNQVPILGNLELVN